MRSKLLSRKEGDVKLDSLNLDMKHVVRFLICFSVHLVWLSCTQAPVSRCTHDHELALHALVRAEWDPELDDGVCHHTDVLSRRHGEQ